VEVGPKKDAREEEGAGNKREVGDYGSEVDMWRVGDKRNG